MEFIDKLNELTNFFKEKKPRLLFIGEFLLFLFVISLVIIIVINFINSKMSYDKLEEKLVNATQEYSKDYPNNLPTQENPTTVIDAKTLIEQKYIKKLEKYVKDSSCTANVNIYYNNSEYKYQAFLKCNTYQTTQLADTLKKNNQLSSFNEGLYEMNNEFVYRGQDPKNYLSFANELWRIVKINTNGQIILIQNDLVSEYYGNWDDRYNTEAGLQKGINTYSLSRALSTMENIYKEKYSKYEELLTPFNVCAEKRNTMDFINDGSIECANMLNNQKMSLLPLYDYINASLDNLCISASNKECENYNYLATAKDKWWTATGNKANTYEVYYIDSYGQIISDEADASATYRYVLALDSHVLYESGDGSQSNPYKVR